MDKPNQLEAATPDQLIKAYRSLRDSRDDAKAAFVKSQKPTLAAMQDIENEMLKRLQADAITSVACPHGTAYTSVRSSAPVKDRQAFLGWLKETGHWEVADIKANAPAIVAFTEEEGELPPGVKLTRETKLNINRGKASE